MERQARIDGTEWALAVPLKSGSIGFSFSLRISCPPSPSKPFSKIMPGLVYRNIRMLFKLAPVKF
jgi:hypothetical protein